MRDYKKEWKEINKLWNDMYKKYRQDVEIVKRQGHQKQYAKTLPAYKEWLALDTKRSRILYEARENGVNL